MKFFKYNIILIFLLISCTPQQRIGRIISRYPGIIAFDSTRMISTIIVPGTNIPLKFSIDSLLSLRTGDTIRIDSNTVIISITQLNDSIGINIHILPDTITSDTTITTGTITPIIKHKRTWTRFDWILIILAIIAALALLRFLFPHKQ